MRSHSERQSCPRRRKPVVGKHGAKGSPTRARQQRVLGCAIRLIVWCPAVGGHALRASRSSQERRECARWARERITSAVPGEAAGGDRLTSMRWCRTSCMQARRCSLRLQSRVAAAVRDPPGVDATAHSRGLRLRGGVALPLTLLAQRTRAAVANAGRIHHAQTAIDLATALLGMKRLSCWTAERPIRLEREVGSREASRFPGGGAGRWPIPGGGRR
jgi:hypothetical protein